MLLFCPTCANLLGIEEGERCLRFACHTCPFVFNVARKICNRIYPRLKEVDDVLGGSAAWENVDSTAERCPKCSHPRAYFMQIQTRSADEPMTTFYKCCNHECGHSVRPMLISLQMIRVSADPVAAVRTAVAQLRAGHVIAVPTDTVYGLAASAQDPGAVALLYQIKARDLYKPIAICVAKVGDVGRWGDCSHLPAGLLSALLPGPVTVVLTRHGRLNRALNPDTALVGVRVPDDPFMRELARHFGGPLALTSANASGAPSSLSPTQFAGLWAKLGGVFDGGTLPGDGTASTVVDLSRPEVYTVLRAGSALKETVARLRKFGLESARE